MIFLCTLFMLYMYLNLGWLGLFYSLIILSLIKILLFSFSLLEMILMLEAIGLSGLGLLCYVISTGGLSFYIYFFFLVMLVGEAVLGLSVLINSSREVSNVQSVMSF